MGEVGGWQQAWGEPPGRWSSKCTLPTCLPTKFRAGSRACYQRLRSTKAAVNLPA
jgi:hypothetical protein